MSSSYSSSSSCGAQTGSQHSVVGLHGCAAPPQRAQKERAPAGKPARSPLCAAALPCRHSREGEGMMPTKVPSRTVARKRRLTSTGADGPSAMICSTCTSRSPDKLPIAWLSLRFSSNVISRPGPGGGGCPCASTCRGASVEAISGESPASHRPSWQRMAANGAGCVSPCCRPPCNGLALPPAGSATSSPFAGARSLLRVGSPPCV